MGCQGSYGGSPGSPRGHPGSPRICPGFVLAHARSHPVSGSPWSSQSAKVSEREMERARANICERKGGSENCKYITPPESELKMVLN